MKKKRDLKAMERRRLRAGRLLSKGVSQAEVARRVGVSRQSVSRWAERLDEGELKALSRGTLGRPACLDDTQKGQLAKLLVKGAPSQGYPTEPWTLGRVGHLIEKSFGIQYSHSQVWRILKGMRFSLQRPTGRAIERDEAAIARWKAKRWPALKKTLENKDESSASSTSRD